MNEIVGTFDGDEGKIDYEQKVWEGQIRILLHEVKGAVILREGNVDAAFDVISAILAENLGAIAERKDPKYEYRYVLAEIIRVAKEAYVSEYQRKKPANEHKYAAEDWRSASAKLTTWINDLFAKSL